MVCCLGPLYHLPPAERERAMRECVRVCRPGGVLAFAYINRVGVYAGACVHSKLGEYYPNERANTCVLGRGVDDMRPEVFFYTMPEEMEETAQGLGLQKLRNLGTDFFFAAEAIDRMDDDKFALYRPLADQMARYESCTGLSNHALPQAGGGLNRCLRGLRAPRPDQRERRLYNSHSQPASRRQPMK